MSKEHEIVLYQTEDTHVDVEVIFADGTFWMTQKEMKKLFKVGISVISKHLSNIFDGGELDKEATVSKMEMVQTKGKNQIQCEQEVYNLDAIIAVVYRVDTKQATRFRQWSTKTLKDHVDDKKTKKGKKKKKWKKLKFVINYIVPIISVISVFFSGFIVREIGIMTDQLQLERNNQSFVLNDIALKYVEEDRYKVLFDKQQGGMKKAYIADIREEGIVYNLLNQSMEDCEIELFPVDTDKIKQYQDNSNIDVPGLKFEDIRQFALVVLDTTDQWNVYYFVVRPEIDGSKCEYKFEVKQEDGQTIAENKEELKKDEMQCAFFDTQLINELTISKKIAILSEKYEYYFFSEPIKIKGKNGEIITSNPYMEIHYTVPTVQEIHDNIVEIYTDINLAM